MKGDRLHKAGFMIRKFIRDIGRSRMVYPIAEALHTPRLGPYYLVFDESRVARGKDQALIRRFDPDGIPLNRTYVDVEEEHFVYYPISIGQMGLAVFHTYLRTGSVEDRERFLKFVAWFERHGQEDPTLGLRWMTAVPLPQYRNPGPWQSAFAQSRGISILLRGYQLTGDSRLARLAEAALVPFEHPVADGGVTVFTPWGPFYEEYTASVPTLVLNGMIFSLFGLYDFVRAFPDHAVARRLFETGIQTLEAILPEYDLGYWSRYNLCRAPWYPDPDPATIGYQRLHVIQLRILFRLTGREVFLSFAERFANQDRPWNAIRMYREKYRALRRLNRL